MITLEGFDRVRILRNPSPLNGGRWASQVIVQHSRQTRTHPHILEKCEVGDIGAGTARPRHSGERVAGGGRVRCAARPEDHAHGHSVGGRRAAAPPRTRWRQGRIDETVRDAGICVTTVPHRPPADLTSRTPTWTAWSHRPLWQFANSAGAHPTSFAQMRRYGRCLPPDSTRTPNRRPMTPENSSPTQRALCSLPSPNYAWYPTRDVDLLDLTGPGAVALGAVHAPTAKTSPVRGRVRGRARCAAPAPTSATPTPERGPSEMP